MYYNKSSIYSLTSRKPWAAVRGAAKSQKWEPTKGLISQP